MVFLQYTEMLYNISRVVHLTSRTAIKSGSKKGANIVSCGGNGIVRFWNAFECILIGEFTAHPKGKTTIYNLTQRLAS